MLIGVFSVVNSGITIVVSHGHAFALSSPVTGHMTCKNRPRYDL